MSSLSVWVFALIFSVVLGLFLAIFSPYVSKQDEERVKRSKNYFEREELRIKMSYRFSRVFFVRYSFITGFIVILLYLFSNTNVITGGELIDQIIKFILMVFLSIAYVYYLTMAMICLEVFSGWVVVHRYEKKYGVSIKTKP